MIVVADTNCLIAALIKDGPSRSIIRNPNYQLVAPDFALDEIWKYREEVR